MSIVAFPERGNVGDTIKVRLPVSPKMWAFVKHCREMGDVVEVKIIDRDPVEPIAELTITWSEVD